MEKVIFSSSRKFLLRAPSLPRESALLYHSREDVSMFTSRPGIWSDPYFREAVLISSPSLARRADYIAAGGDTSAKHVRKSIKSLRRYQLRAATRSTPFGLMAGVAVGTFNDTPVATIGHHHRKHVRADRSWLRDVLAAWRKETGLPRLGNLGVIVNNLCFIQGNRVVVPVATGTKSHTVRRTIRMTTAVRGVLEEAAESLPVKILHARLSARFPEAPDVKIWELLESLIQADVLLTEFDTSHEDEEILSRATNLDPSWEGGHRYKNLLETYAARPVGDGYGALSDVYEATGASNAVHVDLALDAQVKLPAVVATEFERAASLLWRVSDPNTPTQRALRVYHVEFLERYSQGELVPLTKLLDPDAGLGAPASYTLPVGHRETPPAFEEDPERVELLGRLVMDAVQHGRRYVELDDRTVDALSYSEGRQPRSVELFASINAVSLKSIEQGDFELVVSPLVATQQAGASWGRFASMLGAVDDFTEITGHADTEEGHPLPVQLSYSTHHERGANIAAVPHLSDNKLPLGAYDEQHAPGRRIRVEDIMVSADPAGFYLHDLASGMEINPFVPHVLNGSLAPNIAKFLRDALTLGIRPLGKWDWGSLDRLPFLPAIKYGRTRLSPAKWILRSVDLVEDDWDASFDDWRRQWNVPDRIKIGHTDQLVSLDLRIESHRRMLRESLSGDVCTIYESRSPEGSDGWLVGPGGSYEAEIVVPPLRKIAGKEAS